MNTNQLTNATVKAVIDALQKGDQKAWLALFTPDAELYDDGSPRDFMAFSRSAIGEERFTSIYRVENEGKDLYGHFHTEKWSDFNTYFKFHINKEGKIYRLDIGQAG
jgi:ketosteroid isomerase-like protein